MSYDNLSYWFAFLVGGMLFTALILSFWEKSSLCLVLIWVVSALVFALLALMTAR